MADHEVFKFQSLEELQAKAKQLCAEVTFSKDISRLLKPQKAGSKTAPNSMAVLPMEGCDSNNDGSPSELVERRYVRFASGGAGLLWWEACAVVPEGRANPNQMMLTASNVGRFKELLKKTNQAAADSNGSAHKPLNILQLTHSGRYSRPEGHQSRAIIPQHDPYLDPRSGVAPDSLLVTDEYLDALTERYVQSALLAREAGFDGVDIKSCHRYLLSELLASHTREGKYGGSFENRSRFLLNTVRAVRKAAGSDFIVACRFNVFDAHPYPYGFGCGKEDMWSFDPEEPMTLVRRLCEEGIDLLSNSAGNPYYIYPQVTRPFDQSSKGIPIPEEHQLTSIARLFDFTRQIQKVAGDIPVVGNGYSWLRQFAPYAGAANLAEGSCRFVGLGRSSFAYPDAPLDLITKGFMEPKKCCITCSKCTQIMRDHGMTGCVIKDSDIYVPLYRKAEADAALREKSFQ
ncbi:MAG: NADH:flavin oxidoreductase/NADH oxidase [Lacrimispora sp.]|jgi:2,4-dienoyl-CoA reductase-like NADH-dependent reductase (Old Yellow Enzyme family)|nr:NADH:flavin oxidoreductase/NADH oxidase [Lacrimispora sp.]